MILKKKKLIKMKPVKNRHQLELRRQQLKFEEKLHEKEISLISANIIDNLTDRLSLVAFDFGSRLVFQLIKNRKKRQSSKD